MDLKDKKITIIVTGSIAIYKSLDLISALKKLKAKVFVVMSNEALKFINPLCFEAMSGHKVLHSHSQEFLPNSPNHITYASSDLIVVAPASINTIAKLNYGIADTLVLETIIAAKCPILLAPSANINMLEAKQTKQNLQSLKGLGYTIIPPRETLLACNIIANGAMAKVEEILFCIQKTFLKNTFWQQQNVIITGGGSIENIDDIRCISNHSSGKQASNLALAFYLLGAKVTLISSKFPLSLPLNIKQIKVTSSLEYKMALKNELKPESILLMAAAISDYKPKTHKGKLKKETLGTTWQLQLTQNEDLLRQFSCKFKVGFKAESDRKIATKKAKNLLQTSKNGGKDCNMVVLNIIDKSNQIGSDDNEIIIFTKDKEQKINKENKLNISFKIAQFIESYVKQNP